jgi:site-specific DNA-cytosine methylase
MGYLKQFNVFSAFDGCSMAYVALLRAGFNPANLRYFSSEIDKYALKVSKARVPVNMQMGDIRLISGYNYPGLDLLIGGSPCTNLSIAGNGKGLKGNESQLFWEFVRFYKEAKEVSPNLYFLLENVNSMRKKDRTIITDTLGVEPIMIDSALVSAQTRKRLYWTNIPDVEQPEDKGLMLSDVVGLDLVDREKAYCLDANYHKGTSWGQYKEKRRRQLVIKPVALRNRGEGKKPEYNKTGKANALTTVQTDSMVDIESRIRKLTPEECEELQTLPVGWTDVEGVSRTQRYKMVGNGFTVSVISHILRNIPR